MAEVVLEQARQDLCRRRPSPARPVPDRRRRRIGRAGRPFRLRQDDDATADRGAGNADQRDHSHRRPRGQRVPPHRRDVAMVFQRPALYPHLNVRRQSRLRPGAAVGACRTVGVAPSDDRANRHGCWSCPTCWTAGRASFRAASSSGWRWAAPWCGEPAVFLLDEPLSNLDAPPPNGNAPRVALASSPSSGDNGVCHPRSGRGPDARRPRCPAGWGIDSAGRPTAGALRATCQPLRAASSAGRP